MIANQKGWKIILCAALGGLVLGVIARLWMRWISTEPEFTWSGTIFIIMAFTIFTSTQATVYVLRRRYKTKRLTSAFRVGGVIFTLPIFTGAGAGMFPTVVLGSIALWRKELNTKLRITLAIISSIIPTIGIKALGSDFGWSFPTLGRSLLVILIYFLVILLLKPTVTSHSGADLKKVPMSRLRKGLTVFLIVFVALLFLTSIGLFNLIFVDF